MAYLHGFEPPILHRDLKPANLLVTKSMQVKICDFGLSVQKKIKGVGDQVSTPRAEAEAEADTPKEAAALAETAALLAEEQAAVEGQVGGTAPYSAPEVLLGKDFDIGCDVFSMGVIIWEVFTRSRPWDGIHAARISQLVRVDVDILSVFLAVYTCACRRLIS